MIIFIVVVIITLGFGLGILTDANPVGIAIFAIAATIFAVVADDMQKEREVRAKEDHLEILRLCDATGVGWYWEKNSQVACPKDWIKKSKPKP